MKCFLSMFLISSSLYAFQFLERDKIKLEVPDDKVKELGAAQEITVWEPVEEKNVTFIALNLKKVLDKVYGPEWVNFEEIVATCTDGYQPSIPVSRLKEFNSFIAFQRKDSLSFQIFSPKSIELKPFYLIWDNLNVPSIRKLKSKYWPFQLETLNLVYFSEKYPQISPAKHANARVKAGFLTFKESCIACHTINGEGGKKGMELNFPVSVTEYFKESFLKQWLQNPEKIRYGAKMPAISFSLENPAQEINNLFSYLKHMAKNKKAPK